MNSIFLHAYSIVKKFHNLKAELSTSIFSLALFMSCLVSKEIPILP